AIGVSTDAQASWWGGRGIGTMPHGLIAASDGDTVKASVKFADHFQADMNVTVLVDFHNNSVDTALQVAEALQDKLWDVPVDAYGVGSSLSRGQNDFTADVVLLDGRPCAKVGRAYRPNPRLARVP